MHASEAARFARLTGKQKSLLRYLRRGFSDERIAEMLGRETRAVRDDVSHIHETLATRHRTELIRRAIVAELDMTLGDDAA